MGARRYGKGALAPPPEMFLLLQMLSKTLVDEVFMHHIEKMSSASGGFAFRPPPGSCPWTLLVTFVLQTPSLPTLGKIQRATMVKCKF